MYGKYWRISYPQVLFDHRKHIFTTGINNHFYSIQIFCILLILYVLHLLSLSSDIRRLRPGGGHRIRFHVTTVFLKGLCALWAILFGNVTKNFKTSPLIQFTLQLFIPSIHSTLYVKNCFFTHTYRLASIAHHLPPSFLLLPPPPQPLLCRTPLKLQPLPRHFHRMTPSLWTIFVLPTDLPRTLWCCQCFLWTAWLMSRYCSGSVPSSVECYQTNRPHTLSVKQRAYPLW